MTVSMAGNSVAEVTSLFVTGFGGAKQRRIASLQLSARRWGHVRSGMRALWLQFSRVQFQIYRAQSSNRGDSGLCLHPQAELIEDQVF